MLLPCMGFETGSNEKGKMSLKNRVFENFEELYTHRYYIFLLILAIWSRTFEDYIILIKAKIIIMNGEKSLKTKK